MFLPVEYSEYTAFSSPAKTLDQRFSSNLLSVSLYTLKNY